MTKTFHVYQVVDGWAVRKEGTNPKTFSTQQEAIDAAKKRVKDSSAGQFVVHGIKGEVRQRGSRGMTPVMNPPKRSRLGAKRIKVAVGKVVLDRLMSDASSDHSSKK